MQNKDIKLVMSDIDGTIINENNEVSKRTKKAVHALIDQGIEFGLATGRNYESASRIAELLDLNPKDIPIVSLNGIFVNHPKLDYEFTDETINYESCKKFAKLGKKYFMGILYFFEDKVYYYLDEKSYKDLELRGSEKMLRFFNDNVKMKRIDDIADIENEFTKNNQVQKLVFIQDDDYTELVRRRIASEFPNDFDLLMVGPGWAEIMPKTVHKGRAILKYAQFRGIDKDQILTFGDSDNDLTMIERVGMGVAMNNARNSLKVLADYITDTNENDGVAQYIEKNLLKED